MPSTDTDPKPLISHHIFLFPFKWNFRSNTDSGHFEPIQKRLDFDKIKNVLPSKYWHTFQFKIEQNNAFNPYNEYNYFHDFTRDILNLQLGKDPTPDVLQYDYKGIKNGESKFCISIGKADKDGVHPKEYELDLEAVHLNFYYTGVAVLSFHLNNCDYATPEDILSINEYGRRIYPAFLGTEINAKEGKNLTDAPKGSMLAAKIQLKAVEGYKGKIIEAEQFEHYNEYAKINERPFELPSHIQELLGHSFKTSHKACDRGDVLVEPVMDDRMFVLSFYLNTELAKAFAQWDETEGSYAYLKNDYWYSYLFVDGGAPTCASRVMKKDLLDKHSYERWVEGWEGDGSDGHLFGISRYSFVVLAGDAWFTRNLVYQHVRHQYYQMVLLCLIQRASVLRFSGEISTMVDLFRKEMSSIWIGNKSSRVSKLYLEYIRFINKVYFREITPQEQGIELYKMLQEKMDIENQVKDLDGEMVELQQFLSVVESTRLTRLAALLLPPTLLAALFGFTTYPNDYPFLPSLIAFIGLSIIGIILVHLIFIRKSA